MRKIFFFYIITGLLAACGSAGDRSSKILSGHSADAASNASSDLVANTSSPALPNSSSNAPSDLQTDGSPEHAGRQAPLQTSETGIWGTAQLKTRSEMAAGQAILRASPDSLQILYYDDPDGDSLRYARFYSYTATADTAVLGALMRGMDQPYYETAQRRPCRSEGKVYLFSEAEPLKTVYFSTQNDQGCRYIYVIRDGHFLYFDMTPGLVAMLEQQRRYSVKP